MGTVFANNRSVIHAGDGLTHIATAPDVCKTPSPGGPVPIPYPNFAMDSNLSGGSTKTKADGNPIALQSSNLSMSTGDEPGTLGGVVSSKFKGKMTWPMGSIDVQVEGKAVVRFLDTSMHNGNTGNTVGMNLGAPTVAVGAAGGPKKENKPKCKYCKKDKHPFAKPAGTNCGSSSKLAKSITSNVKQHRWHVGSWTIAAHHLICSEAVQGAKWAEACTKFGYDINCKTNGVFLPMALRAACQIHVPLHRGNHDQGKAGGLSYPRAVKRLIQPVLDKAMNGDLCADLSAMKKLMDQRSSVILGLVSSFAWTLTADGRDYLLGGDGCAGVNSVRAKPKRSCPARRSHRLSHSGAIVRPHVGPLSIGT